MSTKNTGTTLALFTAFSIMGAAASALDCPNPGFDPRDTVFKFGAQGSGSAQGVMGTVESLGGKSQNAGAMYFDYSSGELKVCNGTSWASVDVTDKTSGTFPVDGLWAASGTSGNQWTVPFPPKGRHIATLEAFGSGPCFIDIQRPNGSWLEVATKGNISYLHAGFYIAKLTANGFKVAQQFHDAYHPPSGPESQELHNGTLTGWKGINNVNWNGRMRVRNTSYSCTVNFKLWRTE